MRILWSWQRWMIGWSNTAFTPACSALAPSRTNNVGRVVSSPRSRIPASRSFTTVVFSVSPSSSANGCLRPSMLMPRATTQQCPAKWTPSIMIATRSRPVRSAVVISPSATSVARTNRRDTAERDVERAIVSTAVPTGSSPAA